MPLLYEYEHHVLVRYRTVLEKVQAQVSETVIVILFPSVTVKYCTTVYYSVRLQSAKQAFWVFENGNSQPTSFSTVKPTTRIQQQATSAPLAAYPNSNQ